MPETPSTLYTAGAGSSPVCVCIHLSSIYPSISLHSSCWLLALALALAGSLTRSLTHSLARSLARSLTRSLGENRLQNVQVKFSRFLYLG